MPDLWTELDIPPTDDAPEIRRAYARRLKAIDVDRDPAAFQRLRQAFEKALAMATRRVAAATAGEGTASEPRSLAPQAQEEETRRAPDEPPSPGADFERVTDEAALRALRRDVAQALAGDALDTAAALLRTATANGLLPLDDEHALIAALMDRALVDRRYTGERFMAIVRQFGWTRAAVGDAHTGLREQIAARFEAEAWLVRLAAAAQRRPWCGYVDRQERALARIALGQAGFWRLLFIHTGILRWLLRSYARFEPWLRGRVDAARMARLKKALARQPLKWMAMSYWVLNLAVGGLVVLVLAPSRRIRPVRSEAASLDRGIPEGWAAARTIFSLRTLGGVLGALLQIVFVLVLVVVFLALLAAAIAFPPLGFAFAIMGALRLTKRLK